MNWHHLCPKLYHYGSLRGSKAQPKLYRNSDFPQCCSCDRGIEAFKWSFCFDSIWYFSALKAVQFWVADLLSRILLAIFLWLMLFSWILIGWKKNNMSKKMKERRFPAWEMHNGERPLRNFFLLMNRLVTVIVQGLLYSWPKH